MELVFVTQRFGHQLAGLEEGTEEILTSVHHCTCSASPGGDALRCCLDTSGVLQSEDRQRLDLLQEPKCS